MIHPPNFARPASELEDPLLGTRSVTLDPAGGKGLVLDEEGRSPVTTMSGRWIVEITQVSVNITSTALQTGGNMDVTVPGLQVGDMCFALGAEASDARQFLLRTRSTCTVENTITLDYFNADDGTVDPAPVTVNFLCLHRYIT